MYSIPFINSLISCTTLDDLHSLLAISQRNVIIDSLLEFSAQFNSIEYLGQLSFNSDRTQSFINNVSSLPCCGEVKYFLMSLLGDPELHWRCSNRIIASLYWYYRTFAPKNTTLARVNTIGLSLSQDFSVPCERNFLYSVNSFDLPTDILSTSYLAHMSLTSFEKLSSLWSHRFVSSIVFLRSYYLNTFSDKPASFPSPFFKIYDFSVKRLLPSWGGSMHLDQDSLGPFLVTAILSSHKLQFRKSSSKLPSFVLSSPISDFVIFE